MILSYFREIKFSVILLILAGAISQSLNSQNTKEYRRLHEQFQGSIHKNLDSARYYMRKLAVSRNHSDSLLSSYYYHLDSGQYYFVVHQMDSSRIHYQKAYDISTSAGYDHLAIDSDMWLANHEYFKGETAKVLAHWDRILAKSIEADYLEGMATAYHSFADIKIDLAAKYNYLLKVDSLYSTHDTISPVLANTYSHMGNIYLEANSKDPLARYYIQKSLTISYKTGYEPGVFHAMDLLGGSALREQEYEKAKAYFLKMKDQGDLQKNELITARGLLNLANVATKSGALSEVEALLQRSSEIFARHGDEGSLAWIQLLRAEISLTEEATDKALQHLEKARLYQLTSDTTDFRIDLKRVETSYYELTGNYEAAYRTHLERDNLMASLEGMRNQKAFILTEQQERRKKMDREIAVLKAANMESEYQKELQKIFLFALAVILGLLAFIFFYRYRNKQKTNRKLKELDQAKSNFFTNISHEFRTPLTLISSPIQELLAEPGLPAQKAKHLEMALQSSNRLLFLVDQLLNLSKIDSGMLKAELEHGNPLRLISVWAEPFAFLAEQKGIAFELEKGEEDLAWFDRDALEKIIENLLGNAIKYTPKDGKVIATAHLNRNQLHIQVRNTGKGMVKVQMETIFERFYQADRRQEGSGIGLALVKELVALHLGTIAVDSVPDHWTTFNVSLCTDKSQFKNVILKPSSTDSPGPETFPVPVDRVPQLSEGDPGLPILLMVEDNADVLTLLCDTFREAYQVISARHGKEGLSQAMDQIPDLIICDIMMPEMDGIELTKKLKTDERTCHIPVILLTAKAGDENKLTGIETGADDYITKPFNAAILKTKVKNLIALRKKLQSRYSQEVILQPREISITSVDERFLEKVKAILDEKLTRPDFSIEEFSIALHMSRMQLHRKLKALTGLSASDFVRSQRLILASRILINSDSTISEVGYMVGFNDPSYFTKCFKESYGLTPTAYSKRHSQPSPRP